MTPEQRVYLSQTQRNKRQHYAEKRILRKRSGDVEMASVNRGLLVPWAKGKCKDCGNTLAGDYTMMTHKCVPEARSMTRAIDPWWGFDK